jgi:hypothetical protein
MPDLSATKTGGPMTMMSGRKKRQKLDGKKVISII